MDGILSSNWTRRKHYAFSGMVLIAVFAVFAGINITLIVRAI